jgi:hypothetical protein
MKPIRHLAEAAVRWCMEHRGIGWDLLALAGLCFLAAGLWWVWPPVALIGVGALCLLLGLYGAKVWARSSTPAKSNGERT